jgi:hypothetical protein
MYESLSPPSAKAEQIVDVASPKCSTDPSILTLQAPVLPDGQSRSNFPFCRSVPPAKKLQTGVVVAYGPGVHWSAEQNDDSNTTQRREGPVRKQAA